MRKLRITCIGTFPLMMDAMSDEVLTGLITGVRPQINKEEAFEKKAARKIYRENGDLNGKIGLPGTMLFAALVEAGRMVQYSGRKMVSTAKTTLLPAFMTIEGEFLAFPIPAGKSEAPWVVDKRRGRLPDGTAVGLIRPKFKEWGFTVTITLDNKITSPATIQKLFENAGRFQGLGSFRPNCKGPFGTFMVQKFEDITPQEWLDAEKDDAASAKTPAEEPGDDTGADDDDDTASTTEGQPVGAGVSDESEKP